MRPVPAYGVGVGLGVDRLAFSLSFAAFAVACCRRSESDFRRAASGVLAGLTAVSVSDFLEQPAVAKMPRARIESKKVFINLKLMEAANSERPDCYSPSLVSANLKEKRRTDSVRRASFIKLIETVYRGA